MTPSWKPAVAAATVLSAGILALGTAAAPAQAAAPTTTAVTRVLPTGHTGATTAEVARSTSTTGAAVASRVPAPAAAAAAADATDSAARSRLWHQTLAEFGILAAAFALFARRSFKPLRARSRRRP